MMARPGSFAAEIAAAREKALADREAVLFDMSDEDLAKIGQDEYGAFDIDFLVISGGCLGVRVTVDESGKDAVLREKARRATLTAHQRIADVRERMRRRAPS